MKKLLSILGSMGLVATASAGVVACGSSDSFKSYSVELSGDYRDSSKPDSDSTYPGQPAYIGINDVIDKLSDSQAKDILEYLDYSGTSAADTIKDKSAKEALKATVGKDFSYAAAMNVKLNANNIHKNQADILAEQPSSTWLASNAVVPDGSTYQIGLFNEFKNADQNYKWYWIDLKFEQNDIKNVNGTADDNGEVTAKFSIDLPANTTIDGDGKITDDGIKIADDYENQAGLLESIVLANKDDASKFSNDGKNNVSVDVIVKFKVATPKNGDASYEHKYNLYNSKTVEILSTISFTAKRS